MATIFPDWITLGQDSSLTQIRQYKSPEMSDQVLSFVGDYRRRVPDGLFEEDDDFSAILKAIVDVENGKRVNSRETQLQSSSEVSLR